MYKKKVMLKRIIAILMTVIMLPINDFAQLHVYAAQETAMVQDVEEALPESSEEALIESTESLDEFDSIEDSEEEEEASLTETSEDSDVSEDSEASEEVVEESKQSEENDSDVDSSEESPEDSEAVEETLESSLEETEETSEEMLEFTLEGDEVEGITTLSESGSSEVGTSGADFICMDEAYIVSEKDTTLCTLNGRSYNKTNDGFAIGATFYLGTGYTAPVLVSLNPDAVSYTTCGTVFKYSGTVEYLGRTWYVSSTGYHMGGNNNNSNGVLKKLSNRPANATAAAEYLLNTYVSLGELEMENQEIALTGNVNEDGNAVLEWTTEKEGIASYRIYRNTTLLATLENSGEAMSYCDETINSDLMYEYHVYAVDETQHGIATSNSVVLKTLDSLTVNGDYTLSKDMTVFSVTVNRGVLNLNGHNLHIQKDFVLNNDAVLNFGGGAMECDNFMVAYHYGRVLMNNANDYLIVRHNMKLDNYGGSYYGDYSNGTIELGGDFTASRLEGCYQPSNFHTMILNGSGVQNIQLSKNSYFNNLDCRNYSEDGIRSEFGFVVKNCIADENVSIYIHDQKASVGITLEEDMTIEEDYYLGLGTLDLNGHTLTIRGNFCQEGGQVLVNGGSLVVSGDYIISTPYETEVVNGGEKEITTVYGKSGGILTMTNAQDSVCVEGNFYVASEMNHTDHLTNGVLEVKGNFTIDRTYSEYTFVASDKHKVLLSGTGKQIVTAGANIIEKSRLANLEITNTSKEGVSFDGITVIGQVDDHDSVVTGSITIFNTTSFVDTFEGSVQVVQSVTPDYDWNIGGDLHIKGGSVYVTKNINVGGSVYIGEGNDYYSTLYMIGGALNVEGDLNMQGTNYWHYLQGYDNRGGTIYVKGSINAGSRTRMDFSCGTIKVEGDFLSAGDVVLRDTNKVILCGSKKQTISIPESGYFATIELLNTSEEGVYSENVFGRTTLIRNNVHLVYGELQGEFGWTLEADETYEGDLVLIDDVLDLNGHKLTVTGNLIQSAGEVKVNGGTLEIAKDYRIQGISKKTDAETTYGKSSAILRMTNAQDKVVVGGSFITSSATNHSDCLTDGVLEVKGNFTIDKTYAGNNFMANGKHKVVFSGSGKQTVTAGSNVKDGSRIANLEITNTGEEGVSFDGILVIGQVDDHDNVVTGIISAVDTTSFVDTFEGDVQIVQGFSTLKDWNIKGDLKIKGTSLYVRNTINVGGSVYIGEGRDYYSSLVMYGGTLNVEGDLKMQGTDYWHYLQGYDGSGGTVYVKGNLDAGARATFDFSYGTIKVEGDFLSAGTVALKSNNKVILCGSKKQTISIPENGYFATIELLNTSEEGVYSENVFGRTTLIRNNTRLTYGTIQGELGWTLEADETYEGDLVLVDDVLDLNGHKLTVTGNLIQSAGEIKINGGTLEVAKDYRIQSSKTVGDEITYGKSNGILRMTNEQDKVVVGGNFITSTAVNHSGYLTNGVLEVKGDFTLDKSNAETCFVASESHKVVFSGTGKQTVTAGYNNLIGSRIANLEITNTSEEGVSFDGIIVIGQVDDHDCVVNGAITAVDTTSFVDTYNGNVQIVMQVSTKNDWNIKGDLKVKGTSFYVRNTINVGGSVYIGEGRDYYSTITIYGGILNVEGDLQMQGTDYWHYLQCNDSRGGTVHVKGSINAGSRTRIEGSYGTFKVEGDFLSKGDVFLKNKNRVILCGNEKQTVDIPENGYFAILELDNHSKEGIYLTRNVSRDSLVRNGCKMSCADLVWESGWTLEEDETWDGDLLLYDDTLDLNGHTLTVTGDLIQLGGILQINNGHLIVNGDYRLQSVNVNEGQTTYGVSSGRLLLTKENDKMTVYGDIYLQPNKSTNGGLQKGTLEVYGDFIQLGSYPYQGTFDNVVIFAGSEVQTISKNSSTTFFGNFINRNAKGIVNNTGINVYGKVTDESGNISGTGYISVEDVRQVEGSHISGNLTVTNTSWLESDLNVRGDLTISGDFHLGGFNVSANNIQLKDQLKVYVDKGTIICSGGMDIRNNALLIMVNSEDYVLVNDTFRMASYANHNGYLTDGVLEIRGDFTQEAGTNFIATDNHTTILSRKKSTTGRDYIQTVNFKAYAGTTRFNKVVLKKPERQYHFVNGLDKISNEVVISIDDVNPPTALTYLVAESVSETSVKLVFDGATDNVGILGYEIYRNDILLGVTSTNSYRDVSVAPNTEYIYQVYAFDSDRNLAEDSPVLTVVTKPDTEAPTVPGELSMSTRTGSSITLGWLASKDNVKVKSYTLYCEGEVIAENITGTTYKVENLEKNKIYHYSVAAVDGAGNYSEKSNVLEAVVAAPQITNILPADNAKVGGDVVEITVCFKNVGNSTGNKVTLEIQDENAEWVSLSGRALNQKNYNSTELCAKYTWDISEFTGEKEYHLRAILNDADNNTDTKEFTYFVDKQAPAAVTNVKAENRDGNVVISWAASTSADADTYKIFRKAESESRFSLLTSEQGRTLESYVDKNVVEGKNYSYKVSVKDKFGNESDASDEVTILVSSDTKCPEVKDMTPKAGLLGGKIKVEVTATDNRVVSRIGLQFKTENGTDWVDITEGDAYAGKFTYTLDTSVLQDGVYFLNAYAIDASGNKSETDFVRRYEIDNTGIAKIQITKTEVESSYVRIDWEDATESDFAYFQVERVLDSTYEKLATVTDKLGYYVRGLLPNTKYTFRVVGYDKIGNRGIPSDLIEVTTKADTTAPVITEVSPVASYYKDKINLSVTAKDDHAIGKAVFSYSTNGRDYTQLAEVPADRVSGNMQLTYSFDIRSIPEGSLFVKFEVYDKSGNKNALDADGKDIVVEYKIDRTAPAAVKNVRYVNNNGYVELVWDDASAVDSDVKAYRIYRANNSTGVYAPICLECSTKNYYDTTVKIGETYLYKVSAIDLAGNEGECSAEMIVTVSEDNEAPTISGMSPESGKKIGSNPKLQIMALDNSGLSKIKVEYQSESNPGVWSLIANVNAKDNVYLAKVTWDTSGLSQGKYSVRAIPTDIYGNVGDAYVVNYTLDNVAPVITQARVETGHYKVNVFMNCAETDDFSHFEVYRRDVGSSVWNMLVRTVDNSYEDANVSANTTYVYKVAAYDTCGNQSWSSEMSGYADDVDDIAPVISVTENINGLTNMEIELDATACTDNVRIVNYTWEMGNGDVVYGALSRYTYKEAGNYTIILSVSDAAGNVTKASISAHIMDKDGAGKSVVTVVDEKGCAIPYASIYVKMSPTSGKAMKADSKGRVEIVEEVGVYTVAAYKTGYLPSDVEVVVNEYEEKAYTIKLVEDELIVGELTVRRMTLEEMVAAGVDFSNPSNYHSYVFTVNLTFKREEFKIETRFIGEENEATVPLKGGGTLHINRLKTENSRDDDDDDENAVYAYVSTTQTISWLKDMYEVELGVLNQADRQYSVVDSMATLNLPDGLSLAATYDGQSVTQSMGEIAGQQRKSVKWIVKGDKKGKYTLSADFKGVLLPFNEKVSAHFEADTEIDVNPGEGIVITIMPEEQAFIGEDYYIQFSIANEGAYPIYDFSTSIGAFQFPDTTYTYTNVETGETETTTLDMDIEDPSTIGTAIVVHDGRRFRFKTLYPGQAFFGTYKTRFTGHVGEDPDKYYYNLVDSMVTALNEENYGIKIRVKPIESHIHKTYYREVEIVNPTNSNDYVGDPINITSGSFSDSLMALFVRGVNTLSYDLSYESVCSEEAGQMGYGWYSNYEARLENNNGLVRLYTDPHSSLLFAGKRAASGNVSGTSVNGAMVLMPIADDIYGEYTCLNGSTGFMLTRNTDDTYTVTTPKEEIWTFDADGRLIKTCDKLNRSISLTYKDNVTTITEDGSGKQLYLTHNADGLVVSVSDQMERTTSFAYDEDKNLVAVTLPTGDVQRYVYDEEHRIVSESNAIGVFITNTYDDKGRVISQKDENGNEMTLSYESLGSENSNGTDAAFGSGNGKGMIVTVTKPDGTVQKAVIGSNGKMSSFTDADGSVTTYSYDSKGQLLVEKDAKNNAFYREYDSKGNITKIIDKDGTVTTMTYNSNGNVTSVGDGTNTKATYTYDENNHLLKSVDPNGAVSLYEYDANDKVIKQTIEGLGSVSYKYTNGLLTSMTDFNGNVTKSEYNAAGLLTKMTDAVGNVTAYTYDASGRQTSVIYPDGGKVVYTYDCNNNITSETDQANRTTRYNYNVAGRLLSKELPDGSTISYSYDVVGNCVKEIYSDGTAKTFEYDANGNQTKVISADGSSISYTYNVLNQCTSETDANGNVTTYAYYAGGKLLKTTYPDGSYEDYDYNGNKQLIGVSNQNGKKATYAYDKKNNKVSEKNALGEETKYVYDKYGRLLQEIDPNGNITSYEYDANSNCIKKTNAMGVSANLVYDKRNRLTSVYTITSKGIEYRIKYTYDSCDRVTSYTDEMGYVTRMTYDSLGELVSVTDANGNVTSVKEYDSMGRVSAETDASGNKVNYSYDTMGNLIKTVQLLNSGNKESSYSYDVLGRLTSVVENGKLTTGATYDAVGNMTSMIDANGGTTSYVYDSRNRMVKELNAIGSAKEYSYNAEGLLAEITNGRKQKTQYTYDKVGRVASMTDELGTVKYTYDKNGNVLTVTDKNGTIKRTYDKLNRVKQYTDYNGNVVKYSYDELGNMISLTYPGGEIVRYSYYKNGWMKTVKDTDGKNTQYTYDKTGRMLTCTRPNGTKEICTYNAAGALLTQTDVLEVVNGDTTEQQILTSFVYNYDESGNISSIEGAETLNTKEGITELRSASFTYDEANRLVNYNGEEVQYDADGNMTYGPVDGVMSTLEYDCRNRLVKAGGVTYTYDAENNRVSAETDTYREVYVTDTVTSELSRVLVMKTFAKTNGKLSTTSQDTIYTYGAGLISEKEGGIVLYHHYNHLGSTVKLTDGRGKVVGTYTYGTYGELLSGNAELTKYLYSGRLGVSTDSNGLYYMRQRYYNPEIKRFVNQDILSGSIDNSQSLNRYSYAQGNPVSYIDPFGLSPYDPLGFFLSSLHLMLGLLGMIPGPIGIAANILDAIIYVGQGEFADAFISALSAIGAICGANTLAKIISIIAGVGLTALSMIRTGNDHLDGNEAGEREDITYTYMGAADIILALVG